MSLKPEQIDRHSPLARKALNRLARGAKRAATRVRRRTDHAAITSGAFECVTAGRVTRGWAD